MRALLLLGLVARFSSIFCPTMNENVNFNFLVIGTNRYAYPWWKEKVINSRRKRKSGKCPLTPEETALALRALDIDPSIQIYIAAGDIYGGERRMESLRLAFPQIVS